jgi:O-antigen ligase
LASHAPLLARERPVAPAAARKASVGPGRSVARLWGLRLIGLATVSWLASLSLGFHAGLIVLTVAGLAAAVAGLARPALGLLGVVILCTLDPVSRIYLLTGGLLPWNTFNYWLLVVMLLHLGFLVRLRDPQTRLLQLFILLLAAGLAFSSDLMGGLQHVFNIVILFGLLITIARVGTDRETWYWSAMLSGVIAALGSLVFYLQQDSLPAINENAWSFFPLASLFVTCAYFTAPVRRPSGLLALLALVNSVWVFLSGSRGSFLICVVCLLFILARLRAARGSTVTLAVGVLLAIAISVQFGGQGGRALDRLTALFDTDRSISTRTSGRWDLAQGGWRIFLDHPLGIGTGGFPQAWATLENREGMSGFREGTSMQAHSGWIKVLAENGVFGIVLFAAFILSFAMLGWRRRAAGLFLPGLLVSVAMSVAFLADEFQGKGLWLLAAVVMTALRRAPGKADRSRTHPARGRAPVARSPLALRSA